MSALDPTNPIDAACMAVAADMVERHGWNVDNEYEGVPELDCAFYQVMRRHFEPLIGMTAEDFRRARVEMLRAEIERLEAAR